MNVNFKEAISNKSDFNLWNPLEFRSTADHNFEPSTEMHRLAKHEQGTPCF